MKKADEIDFTVYGDDMQFVEIGLDSGESVIAEAGAMMYMDDGIEVDSKFGAGSKERREGCNGNAQGCREESPHRRESFYVSIYKQGTGEKPRRFCCPLSGENNSL